MIQPLLDYHPLVVFSLWYGFSTATLWKLWADSPDWADSEGLPSSGEKRRGMWKWIKLTATVHADLRQRVSAWLLYPCFTFQWLFLLTLVLAAF